MKNLKTIISLIFIILAITSCKKSDKKNLCGCWKHSYEESYSTYRPCDYKKFPASRFRFKMDLKKNEECEWLSLDDDDSHSIKPGYWNYFEETNLLEIKDKDGNIIKSFSVDLIEKDKLILN